MKKALSVILALAVVISCLSMITVFAADSVYGKNLLGEAESTFTGQTSVPSAWGKQGNTPTLAIAEDPAEAGNKVLQSVTKRSWESPLINIASAIKNAMTDASLTDVEVEISMRVYVKADAGMADAADPLARMVLRSNKEFSFVSKAGDGNIFRSFSSAGTKYNTWYTLTGLIYVKAADLAMWTEDAYLNLCMDSIKTAAESNPVTLLVDDVSVAFIKYDGVKVTATQDNKMTFIASTATKGFIPEASGDTVVARVVLSNASNADIYARLKPSVLHTRASGDSWESLAVGEYQLVPAGKSVELKVNVPANKEIEGKAYTYADAFIRIDVSTKAGDGAPLPKDTVLYVSGNDLASGLAGNGNGYTAEVVKKEDLPESVNDLWTPDPVYAEVVNGNAENGTEGWSVFTAGSIEQVEGGANGTAHAVKYIPNANKWGSIAFDFGPAIIQDEANGYKGAGVGEYTVTFWAKTDSPAPKNTKFQFILNSQEHQGAASDQGRPVNSWLSTKQMVELTDQWKQYEVKLTVTEDYLKTVKALYDAGSAKAYQLVLRLDGSEAGSAYDSGALFSYYVDEVTIAAASGETEQPSGGEEATEVQGVTVKVTSADEGAGVYVKFDQFAGHLKNGKMTVKIHNTGKSEVKLVLEARLNDKSWTTVKAGETVTVAAGKVATLTIDCPDKMTSPIDSKEYVPFMLLKIDGAKAGDQFTVYGFTKETMETQKPVSTITTKADGGPTASLEYGTTTKACPTGDAAPVAIIAVAVAACVMLGLVVAAKKKKETV